MVHSMLGVAGTALDIAFHTLDDSSVALLLDGFDEPFPTNALALSAHIMFFGAFSILILLPTILFGRKPIVRSV